MKEEEYYDEMMVKVILIGDSSVGKTNIMSKYLKGQFQEIQKQPLGLNLGQNYLK